MERTKKISTQTLAIAILSLLLIASLVMTATGAWFTSATDTIESEEYTFGTIVLGDIASDFTFNLDEPTPAGNPDVIMPGDSIDVTFSLINNGTADMWVRFQLLATGDDIFTADLSELLLDEENPHYGQFTIVGDGTTQWVYLNTSLVGNLGKTGNTDLDVALHFVIPTDYTTQAGTVSFSLVVQAVQVANNGTEPTPYNETTNLDGANWGV